jgi:hypothetical protein
MVQIKIQSATGLSEDCMLCMRGWDIRVNEERAWHSCLKEDLMWNFKKEGRRDLNRDGRTWILFQDIE